MRRRTSGIHDWYAVREAIEIRFFGKVIKSLTRQGHRCQLVVAELSRILAELIQQPPSIRIGQAADDLQEVPRQLWVGHGVRLSPLRRAAASGGLQPQVLHIRQEVPVAE